MISADWAAGYGTPLEASTHSDLAVVGIIGAHRTEFDQLAPNLPTTLYQVTVQLTVRGASPKTIIVTQTGGLINGTMYHVDGDPMMQTGERSLLFLKHVVGGPYDGSYFVIGGPTGRYDVQSDDTVTSPGVSVAAGTTLAGVLASLSTR